MRGRGALGEYGARARLRTEVLCGGSVSAVVERVAHRGDGSPGAALPSQQMDGLFRDVEAAREHAGRPVETPPRKGPARSPTDRRPPPPPV